MSTTIIPAAPGTMLLRFKKIPFDDDEEDLRLVDTLAVPLIAWKVTERDGDVDVVPISATGERSRSERAVMHPNGAVQMYVGAETTSWPCLDDLFRTFKWEMAPV